MKKYESRQLSPKGKILSWILISVWISFLLYMIFFKSRYDQIFWLFYPVLFYFIFYKKIWIDKDSRKIIIGYKNAKFGRISFGIDTITSIRIVRSRKGKYRHLIIRSGQYRFTQIDPREYEEFINEVTSLNNSIEILTYSTWDVQHSNQPITADLA